MAGMKRPAAPKAGKAGAKASNPLAAKKGAVAGAKAKGAAAKKALPFGKGNGKK